MTADNKLTGVRHYNAEISYDKESPTEAMARGAMAGDSIETVTTIEIVVLATDYDALLARLQQSEARLEMARKAMRGAGYTLDNGGIGTARSILVDALERMGKK